MRHLHTWDIQAMLHLSCCTSEISCVPSCDSPRCSPTSMALQILLDQLSPYHAFPGLRVKAMPKVVVGHYLAEVKLATKRALLTTSRVHDHRWATLQHAWIPHEDRGKVSAILLATVSILMVRVTGTSSDTQTHRYTARLAPTCRRTPRGQMGPKSPYAQSL